MGGDATGNERLLWRRIEGEEAMALSLSLSLSLSRGEKNYIRPFLCTFSSSSFQPKVRRFYNRMKTPLVKGLGGLFPLARPLPRAEPILATYGIKKASALLRLPARIISEAKSSFFAYLANYGHFCFGKVQLNFFTAFPALHERESASVQGHAA